jgi:putative peptidoglycan lipid II flippase
MKETVRVDGRNRLVRQSALTTVAAGAAVASGLVLDASIASQFGAGRATDAFFVAARIPLGLLAVLMVAGNQVLVPMFSTWMTRMGRRDSDRLVSLVLVMILAGGAALAGAASLVAYPLMRLSAPGLGPDQAHLAASVARIMLLLIPLVGLAEVFRAVLNSRSAFAVPAGMNVVMNGIAAAAVAAFAGVDVHLVAWAYVVGAGAQLSVVAAMAWRLGFRFVPRLTLRDPELKALGKLSVRPLAGAGLNPAARVCEQLVVSFLPPGSITILNYGYRLISAIGGSVFFRSVMVTLLPRLTRASAQGDEAEVGHVTRLGLQMMLAVSLPLTAFMAVLSGPLVRALFRRGSFSAADASLLGLVLAVYAASLVGSALQRALLAPFFARLDTRIPLRNTLYGVVANVVLLMVAVLPFRHHTRTAVVGVAIAYSLAQYVNLAHAWFHLRRLVPRPLAGTGRFSACLVAASVISAAVMIAGSGRLDLGTGNPAPALLVRAVVTASGGAAAFALVFGLLSVGALPRGWPGPRLAPPWRGR